jgi:hypothetical protein
VLLLLLLFAAAVLLLLPLPLLHRLFVVALLSVLRVAGVSRSWSCVWAAGVPRHPSREPIVRAHGRQHGRARDVA